MKAPRRGARAFIRERAASRRLNAGGTCATRPGAVAAGVNPSARRAFRRMARSGSRGSGRVVEDLDPRQLLPLEELEAGAAAGGDVREAVGEAELVDRRRGIAAANDRNGAAIGEDLGQSARPLREIL